MIHHLVKAIVVDGFFTLDTANTLANITYDLEYQQVDFGQEIPNFNLVDSDADQLFSQILNTNIQVNRDNSGIFRKPNNLIHFESFDNLNEWVFMVALQPSTLNIFEHTSKINTALAGYKFNYRNLFEWNLTCNFLLSPGQGVLFRPWLFHSFDTGLIQIFRLQEHEDILHN